MSTSASIHHSNPSTLAWGEQLFQLPAQGGQQSLHARVGRTSMSTSASIHHNNPSTLAWGEP